MTATERRQQSLGRYIYFITIMTDWRTGSGSLTASKMRKQGSDRSAERLACTGQIHRHRHHYNPNRRHFNTGILLNVCTAVSVCTGGRKSGRMRFERTQGSTHASPHAVEIGQLAVQEVCFECGRGSGELAAWHLDVIFVR